ncbi:LytTR family DNA-binding domain-containing protein [Maribacter aestuarii]|uniref:LytTR family DNA-binding domain-containing protein n=1 Tax=Maribacter aestuarii TaxID=1130723 RepID=UPI00248A9B88|nr:LytTR family DNA-binding domain-containing protein [Maribacter aestuarii]
MGIKMLAFIFKQIPYSFNFKKQLLIGVFLGGIVMFIMISLQPFGTYGFESDYKYLIFSGFGLLIKIAYLFCARMENLWYTYRNKRWEVRYEILSFIGFILVSSVPIHFYNQVFLNNLFSYKFNGYEHLKHGLWFFGNSIVPIMVILLPFYLYFRNKFGVLITKKSLHEIKFFGVNKGEKITLQKEEILFVKASENYIRIFYITDNIIKQVTFRNTLKAIKKQAPFLYRSHRSYLVNASNIKSIMGNSQNAKIAFHYEDVNVPLSKSYYKTIKSAMDT